LVYPDPAVLPFDHDDVWIYLDNLFLDGLLQPVPYLNADVLVHQWVTVGIHSNPQADQTRRLEQLITAIASSIPDSNARHHMWLAFAQRWAELIALWNETSLSAQQAFEARLRALREQVDAGFLTWVEKRYGSLHNLPSSPPVMLHYLPRYIVSVLESSDGGRTEKKVALLLLDGLALDQWTVLRKVLEQQ